jgi:hypothetical protein
MHNADRPGVADGNANAASSPIGLRAHHATIRPVQLGNSEIRRSAAATMEHSLFHRARLCEKARTLRPAGTLLASRPPILDH